MALKGWRPAPLSSSFMLTAILGFVISAMWVYTQSVNWGFTFLIFFTIMFIASVISMTHAPIDEISALDRIAAPKRISKLSTIKKRRKPSQRKAGARRKKP